MYIINIKEKEVQFLIIKSRVVFLIFCDKFAMMSSKYHFQSQFCYYNFWYHIIHNSLDLQLWIYKFLQLQYWYFSPATFIQIVLHPSSSFASCRNFLPEVKYWIFSLITLIFFSFLDQGFFFSRILFLSNQFTIVTDIFPFLCRKETINFYPGRFLGI